MRARVGKVCAYSHTLGVSTFASEPRTFSARAPLNEDECRRERSRIGQKRKRHSKL